MQIQHPFAGSIQQYALGARHHLDDAVLGPVSGDQAGGRHQAREQSGKTWLRRRSSRKTGYENQGWSPLPILIPEITVASFR